jgi:hypothetical protein
MFTGELLKQTAQPAAFILRYFQRFADLPAA